MYTIGQLAEIVGVSPKALRLYEKKGLICPERNDANNYRLYGEETKAVLQKIVMMKFLGFSLESIKMFLEETKTLSAEGVFVEQKRLLEQKKEQLETVISCIDKAILECRENQLNIDGVLESMNLILKNRKADELVWELCKYSPKASEWNCWVFEQAEIKEGDRILDAGAGWGQLWRKNQKRLPADIHVTCVDLHHTWADSFEEDVQEMEKAGEIGKNCFSFHWGDMEKMEFKESYDCIFFNHTARYMKDGEKMLRTFSECLAENGVFICTWGGLRTFYQIREWISEYGTGMAEIEKKSSEWELWIRWWEEKLNRVFPKVEKRVYEIELFFDKAEDCYEFILRICKKLSPVLEKEKKEFLRFLRTKQDESGKITMNRDTYLYRCSK